MRLNDLGSALRHLRRFDKAISAHTRAVTVFRELGGRHGEDLAREGLQRTRRMRRSDGGGTRGYRRKLTGRERER